MSDLGAMGFPLRRYSRPTALRGAVSDAIDVLWQSVQPHAPVDRFQAIAEYGADVAVAQRIAVFVQELGGLTPTCVRDGWTSIRSFLIRRGDALQSYFDTATATGVAGLVTDERRQIMGTIQPLVAAAKALPVSPTADMLLGDSQFWQKIVLKDGNTASWTEPEVYGPASDVAAHGLAGASAVDAAWSAARWPAYIALQPVIAPLGPTGYVVFWAGVAVVEITSAVVSYLNGRPSGTTGSGGEIDQLYQQHILHLWWMGGYVRSIFRQLYATHGIALMRTTPQAQHDLLRAIDPRKGPTPPEVWDGTFPSAAEESAASEAKLPLWALGLAALGAVGLLYVLVG